MQDIVDAARHAKHYSPHAFDAYRELCYRGEYGAGYDKSGTYSAADSNAEFRHYLT
jgi:hypothetical protein